MFSPRTKHIALKYHHFRSHVKSGRVDIVYRPTEEQLVDLLTKPLSNEAFYTLRYLLCGWGYKSKQTWISQGLSPTLGILPCTPVGYISSNWNFSEYFYLIFNFISEIGFAVTHCKSQDQCLTQVSVIIYTIWSVFGPKGVQLGLVWVRPLTTSSLL